MNPILQKIALKHSLKLEQIVPLQGGDINDVFLLKCISVDFVIKLNNAHRFPNMFEVEAKGLKLLASSNSFRIPKVKGVGIDNEISYLLLEYIPSGKSTHSFWKDFAFLLSKLHKTTNKEFGLSYHNYIGSLKQLNDVERTASEFYINQRLEPQFKLANDKGFVFSSLDRFYKNISEVIPDESPSLIHGDLWNGNYLISDNNEAILIDPAVAFAPREMDLAMMQLFGGFPQEVYSIYNEQLPLIKNWNERIQLWQLYYLLVHLNLFGSGYLSQVSAIINRYS